MTTQNDWSDYKYFFVPGKLDKPELVNRIPYTETHKGEKGIVFFADDRVARWYRENKINAECTLCRVETSPEPMIRKSLTQWGCNVAYSIRLTAGQLIRDVSDFKTVPLPDAPHSHRKTR